MNLLSFFLPFQTALHINAPQTTVYGFKIDYLIPTIFLTDIFAALIIILGFKNLKIISKYKFYVLIYFIFVLINIYNSFLYFPAIYKWLKVSEFLLLGLVISSLKKIDVFKNFIKPLAYSILIACLLGILQFINKGSIDGIFYWFGERNFNFSDPGISPYPYSTFSHPNSFAGFLLVFSIFLLQFRFKFERVFFWILVFVIGINLILTNSLNVFVTIFVLTILRFGKNIGFSYLFFSFSDRFITHRLELINASMQMIKDNFFFGVGLNNFIPNLIKTNVGFLNFWELQPVHNIFLLLFSETGFIGFSLFVFLILNSLLFLPFNYPLLAILITGLSDHYWLTLQQNILFFVFVLALSKKQIKK